MMQYSELPIKFQNQAAGVTLAGTLTVPACDGRYPAAILVHGQGPLNRDQSLLGMRPFKTMAHLLAGQGIATLRYDKRGVAESEGDFSSVTIDDLASDAQAAYDSLATREEIDRSSIGFIGISEGGVVAPLVASRSATLAFCVMLAGPVLAGHKNLALSLALLARGSLERDRQFTYYRERLGMLFELIGGGRSSRSNRETALQIAAELSPRLINENTSVILGGIERMAPEELLEMLSSPCLTAPFVHDPGDYLPKIECPLLALYGAKDVHVPAKEHLAEIKRILGDTSARDCAIMEIPDVNHLFQRCLTGFPNEYTALDHDISPEVVTLIGSWILKRSGKKG